MVGGHLARKPPQPHKILWTFLDTCCGSPVFRACSQCRRSPRQEIDEHRGLTNGEIKAREASILRDGLPCKLLLKKNGDFAMLAAEPLPGWCWLASDAALHRWAQEDSWWVPHVSLGWQVDEDPQTKIGGWERAPFWVILAGASLGGLGTFLGGLGTPGTRRTS